MPADCLFLGSILESGVTVTLTVACSIVLGADNGVSVCWSRGAICGRGAAFLWAVCLELGSSGDWDLISPAAPAAAAALNLDKFTDFAAFCLVATTS